MKKYENAKKMLSNFSFREQPIVTQEPNSTEVVISWSEAYLNLVKCVDYFFVQYTPSDKNG